MTRTSVKEYQRILDIAIAIMDGDVGLTDELVTAELAGCLHSGGGFVIATDAVTGIARTSGVSPDWAARPLGTLLEVCHVHPNFEHYRRTGSPQVLDASALVGAPSWHNGEIRAVSSEVLDATQHLTIPLAVTANSVRAFCIGRSGPAYSGSELDLAERARKLLAAVGKHRAYRPERVPEHGLTPREITVLRLLTHPLPAKTIARRLGISLGTVHKHTENLYRKLGTTDRLSTIQHARCLGLLGEGGV